MHHHMTFWLPCDGRVPSPSPKLQPPTTLIRYSTKKKSKTVTYLWPVSCSPVSRTGNLCVAVRNGLRLGQMLTIGRLKGPLFIQSQTLDTYHGSLREARFSTAGWALLPLPSPPSSKHYRVSHSRPLDIIMNRYIAKSSEESTWHCRYVHGWAWIGGAADTIVVRSSGWITVMLFNNSRQTLDTMHNLSLKTWKRDHSMSLTKGLCNVINTVLKDIL